MSYDEALDALKVAEQRSTEIRPNNDVRILGWNYTLNIDDGKGGYVTIFLAENFRMGDDIYDIVKTGRIGKILRKEEVREESQRAS